MENKIVSQIINSLEDKQHDYYYEKRKKRIVLLSKQSNSFEIGDFDRCEMISIQRAPEEFIKIEPLSDMDVFEWMNEFCSMLEDSQELANILFDENPFDHFLKYVNENSLASKWKEFYQRQLKQMALNIYNSST